MKHRNELNCPKGEYQIKRQKKKIRLNQSKVLTNSQINLDQGFTQKRKPKESQESINPEAKRNLYERAFNSASKIS